jgi:lipoate-protein ligase A
MKWQILESGLLAPDAIMQKDFYLLRDFRAENPPLLHFYEWDSPCLTYGYFIKPSDHINLEALAQYGLKVARRPTGGGIIFHTTDFAFSVFLPAAHPEFSTNTLENYALVNQRVAKAIQAFTNSRIEPTLLEKEQVLQAKENSGGFCMANPTQFDLVIEGKKVGGAAQRRTKQGLLHQGSISLKFPSSAMLGAVLKNQSLIVSAMEKHSYCLLKDGAEADLNQGRQSIKKFIQYYVANDE